MQKYSRKWKWLIVVFIFGTIVLFRESILHFGISQACKHFFTENKISYEKLLWDTDGIALQNVSMETDGCFVEIPKVSVSFSFRLLFHVETKLTCSRLQVILKENYCKSDQESFVLPPFFQKHYFSMKVAVDDGEIFFQRGLSLHEIPPVYFTAIPQEECVTTFAFYRDKSKASNPELLLDIKTLEDHLFIQGKMDNMDAGSLLEIVSFFVPSLENSWETAKGEVGCSGEILIDYKGVLQEAYARADISQLYMQNSSLGLRVIAKQFHFDVTLPEEEKSSLPIWQKISSFLEIQDGEILLLPPLTGKEVGMKDVNLQFSTKAKEDPMLKMKGVLLSSQNEAPFQVEGSGKVEDPSCMEAKIFLKDVNQEVMQMTALLSPKGKNYLLQTQFAHCSSSHVTFVEDLLGFSFFQTDALLKEGMLEGSLLSTFSEGKCQEIELRDLHVQGIKLYFPQLSHTLFFPEIKANMELFSKDSTWELKTLKMDGKGGSIDILSQEAEVEVVDEMTMHLNLDGENILSSSIEGSFRKGRFSIKGEGILSRCLLHAHMEATSADAMQILSIYYPELPFTLPSDAMLSLASVLKWEEKSKKIFGNLTFLMPQKPAEVLEASVDLSPQFFTRKTFESGSFRMRKLSSEILSSFVKPLFPSADLQGNFFLEGTFTPKSIEVSLGGKNISWKDAAHEVHIPSLGEDSVSKGMKMRYFFTGPQWSIELPLYKAKIEEKDHGLLGDNIEAKCLLTCRGKKQGYFVHVSLGEGKWKMQDDLKVDNLQGTILYENSSSTLSFHEMNADIAWKNSSSYHFQSKKCLVDFAEKSLEFDASVNQMKKEVLYLSGKAAYEKNQWQVLFSIDKTRVLGTPCKITSCVLSPSFTFSELILHPTLSFSSLGPISSLLEDVGIFTVAPSFKTYFDLVKGELSTEITYHGNLPKWQVSAHGKDLTLFSAEKKSLEFSFYTEGKAIFLEHLRCDDLTASAKIQKQEDALSFSSLDVKTEKCSFIGNALFHLKEEALYLKMDRAEVDLTTALRNYPSVLQAAGNVKVDLSQKVDQWHASGAVQVNFMEKGPRGLCVRTKEEVVFSANPSKGIQIHEGLFFLQDQSQQKPLCLSKVHQFSFAFSTGEWKVEELEFSLSPNITEFLGTKEKGSSLLENLSWKGFIEGSFSARYFQGNYEASGKIKEGVVSWNNLPVDLRDFSYSYEKEKLVMDGKLRLENFVLPLQGEMQMSQEMPRKIEKMALHLGASAQETGLTIEFGSGQGNMICKSVEGSLFGMTCSLTHKETDEAQLGAFGFSGRVDFAFDLMGAVLSKEMFKEIKKLGLSRGFSLQGEWVIPKEEISKTHFTGKLVGENFDLLGYKFETLQSSIEIEKDRMLVEDVQLEDPAGKVSIKQCKLKKLATGWKVYSPQVKVHLFQPTKLKSRYGGEENIKPFILRHVDFFEVKGDLDNLDTFTAKGYAHFTNYIPKSASEFSIPQEILKALGFDFSVFVPISGEVTCHIQNRKLYFDELKNSFSEGKKSEFFLTPGRSFIDFQGNVCIDVKMKQNVAVKLSDPLVVEIRGTVKEPKYSLTRM